VPAKLEQLRALVHACPDATEAIRYGIPTFVLGENLSTLPPTASYRLLPHVRAASRPSRSAWRHTRPQGTVQFPIDHPLPLDLIGDMVAFRVAENRARMEARSKKKG
jgi:uncharacterized protein YdhG (YjbR/CyaY superfamily)